MSEGSKATNESQQQLDPRTRDTCAAAGAGRRSNVWGGRALSCRIVVSPPPAMEASFNNGQQRVMTWNLSVPYKLVQGPMSSIGQTVVKGTPVFFSLSVSLFLLRTMVIATISPF